MRTIVDPYSSVVGGGGGGTAIWIIIDVGSWISLSRCYHGIFVSDPQGGECASAGQVSRQNTGYFSKNYTL